MVVLILGAISQQTHGKNKTVKGKSNRQSSPSPNTMHIKACLMIAQGKLARASRVIKQ